MRLDHKSPTANTTLGSVLLAQGYVGPATKAYQEAAKLAPEDATIHWLVSNSMEKSGDGEGAIAELETFIKLGDAAEPRVAKAKEHLEVLKAR